MPLAAVTLFFASALLFLVQPMTARHVLPMLGGTSAVWTTCMLFFQTALLAGYAYAHKAPRPVVHLALVALGIAPLCLTIPPFWTALAGDSAVLGLLLMLAVTIGLPFFVLSTTSPLVQSWQAAREPSRDPYVLFAASNAGSLTGLLAYPLLVEPNLALGEQRVLLTVGYAVVACAIAACALRARTANVVANEPAVAATAPRTSLRERTKWLLLAFVPSSLLLGVTTHVTTNLAPVPLLWAIPLALYLITFVIAFARRPSRRPMRGVLPKWLPTIVRWHETPRPVVALLPLPLLALVVMFWWEKAEHGFLILLLHLVAVFFVQLALHGRLADERPEPARLTEFYLWISIGGALGGACNALVAPLVFPAPIEYPAMLALACFLLPTATRSKVDVVWGACFPLLAAILFTALPRMEGLRLLVLGPPAVLLLFFAERSLLLGTAVTGLFVVGASFTDRGANVLARDRSVYGAHHVERLSSGIVCLVNGNILHGAQSPSLRGEPLTYYHRGGPCGEMFRALAGRIPHGRVGAVGLGTGSIAAYGASGERWTFFEIDAAIERTARAQFTFLADSAASTNVRIGDGRLALAAANDGEFGLLVFDAFNSDAVPVHLLTREALAIYLQKLAPGGVLAFHVSSRYLDLMPLLGDLAADARLVARGKQQTVDEEIDGEMTCDSEWVVMARRAEDLAGIDWPELAGRGRAPWTDDRSSLWREMKLFR